MRYELYEDSLTDMAVAYAIHRGVLSQEDVPAEVWPHLQRQLFFYRSMEAREQPEAG